MSTTEATPDTTQAPPTEKKTPTRIYVVSSRFSSTPGLIRATSQAQALTFASSTDYAVAVATQDDLEKHLGEGVKVEKAGG